MKHSRAPKSSRDDKTSRHTHADNAAAAASTPCRIAFVKDPAAFLAALCWHQDFIDLALANLLEIAGGYSFEVYRPTRRVPFVIILSMYFFVILTVCVCLQNAKIVTHRVFFFLCSQFGRSQTNP